MGNLHHTPNKNILSIKLQNFRFNKIILQVIL